MSQVTAPDRALPPPPAPDLPPATAAYRVPRKAKWQAAAALVALCVGLSAAKGHFPPPLGVWGIIVVGTAWLALKNVRDETVVGPGWLSRQGLFRRTWVRTDQLVKVTVGRSGIDHVVVLKDRDGRKAGVMYSDLGRVKEVLFRLALDIRTSQRDGLVLKDRAAALLLAAKEKKK